MANAFSAAADIERSLEMLAEQAGDPTPLVYARLFRDHPHMRANFARDINGAIKGEMLARVFEAILDFVGERRYAHLMIRCEAVTHEGFEVERDVFATFFGYVAQAAKSALGDAWTPAFERAWSDLLVELDHYVWAEPVP